MPNFNFNELTKFQLRWNFLTAEIIILFFADIVLINIPLTNILGYEYSAVNAVLITLLSGLYVVHLLKKGIFKEKEDTFFFLNKVFKGNLFFLILPFVISFVSAIFIRNCSFFYGTLFYSVLTVPSIVIGTALGLLCYSAVPRFPRLLFLIVFFLILLLPIFEIFYNPQIYFYNPIFGYYPGTIYDESVKVDFKLVSYRLLNLLYFGIVAVILIRFIATRKHFSLMNVLSLTGAAIIIAGLFIFFGSMLGFSTTESRLKSELSGSLETENFLICFDKRISRNAIENLALHHEYYFQEAVHYLNAEPKTKITSFIFFDSQQKKKLLGSAAADVAMPWKNQIFINYESYDETLKHEIAHCITADFGVTPFRVASGFNPSLLEGIATAVDNEYNYNTVHYMAALAYNNGYRFPIESIFTGLNFFGHVSSLAYVYSGSFIKYLVDRYGVERFKKIYQGESYYSVYTKSLNELATEYYYFIGSLNLAVNRPDEANYHFGRQTIFKKVCARYVASEVEDGWNLYNQEKYSESKESFEKLLEYSGSYQALLGYIYSLRELEDMHVALAVIDENISKFKSTSYYYNLELLKGDLSVVNKEFFSAGSIYRELIKQNPSRDYYCISAFRERIIGDTSVISRYINGSEYDKYTVLKRLNADSVFTVSIPVMINLSEKLDENYHDFLNYIKNRLPVYDIASSYAALKMSRYALKKNDLQNARVFALTAMNYRDDKSFSEILDQHMKMVDWFLYSSGIARFNFRWNN